MTQRPRFRFAPRPAGTVAAVAAALLFVALGQWQLGRAAEKRALYEEYARAGAAVPLPPASAPASRYQRVTASGLYDPRHQFLLDNMSHGGQAGVEVLTPLLRADGSAVLVDRGWLPFGATRASPPEVAVAADPRTVAGRVDQLPRAAIRLEAEPRGDWPRLVSFPTMDELSALLGRKLYPQVILLDPRAPDGYVREWHVPGATPDRHLGYAIQWFAFAATAVAIWIALGLSRSGESR